MDARHDSATVPNAFLAPHQFQVTTELSKTLVQLIQRMSERVSLSDYVFLGVLTYCGDSIRHHNLQINTLSLFFWHKISLQKLIEDTLHITPKKSLDPYKKIIYLSAFLHYLNDNFTSLAISLNTYEAVKACTRSALLELKNPIISLMKKRPTPQALTEKFSALLLECRSNKELGQDRYQFIHLMTTVVKEAGVLDGAKNYGYNVRFGAVLFLLLQLDRVNKSSFYKACLKTIHIDDIQEISPREKMHYLAGLYAIIPKVDPNETVFYNIDYEIQKQLLQQMTVLNYSKYAVDSLQQLGALLRKNLLSTKWNYLLEDSLKQMNRLIGHTREQLISTSTFTHSLLSYLPGKATVNEKAGDDPEFIAALLLLPDELLSAADKSRIRGSVALLPSQESSLYEVERNTGISNS